MTLVSRVLEHAARQPERPALIVDGAAVSYGQLASDIRRAAAAYHAAGIKSGDRVALRAVRRPAFVAAYLGAHLAGVVTVPIPEDTPAPRMELVRDKAAPRLVLWNETDLALGSAPPEGSTPPPPDPDRPADIVFTTGTTGLPKGVVLTHANLCGAADQINAFIGTQDTDVEVLALPLGHSFGLGRLRCVLAVGGTLVLVGGFTSLKRFFSALESHRATGFAAVPSAWAYLRRFSGDRLGKFADQIRYVEIGSAEMPLQDKLALMRLLPRSRLCMHYGLTEASRSAFIEFHSEADHLDTLGRAAPGVEIAVMNQRGEALAPGEEGEICVKGPAVMLAYLEDPESTRDSFHGGWLRTGDWGRMDPDGYIRLIARKKELINVGGRKVSPLEVERAILEMDHVEDCACAGIRHDIVGEAVKAFIVLAPSAPPQYERSVIEFLASRLETYKLPVEIEPVTRIPRTASGKTQRRLLARGLDAEDR